MTAQTFGLSPNILFLVAIPLVVFAELWGVWRNAKRNGEMDTISEWVWKLERTRYVGPVIGALVFAFCASLAMHLWRGWALLP